MKIMTKMMCMAAGALFSAGAAMGQVVISQVYGGGGNSGATYTQDFVELFNRGSTPVTMTNWSLQYQTQAATSWAVIAALNATIQPGQYYLVSAASAATGGPLPTVDAVGANVNINASQGKIVLVNNTIAALPAGCPTTGVVDKVGFGTTSVACNEGGANAPAPSNNVNAMRRASSGCTDTDVNSADFAVAVASARNSSTPFNSCTSTVTGACCAPIGDCTVTTSAACTGAYQGDNSPCVPTNPCVATVGACCFASGACTTTAGSGCTGNGATFNGLGVTCAVANCPSFVSACCNTSDGTCTVNYPANCPSGTTATGAGTSCTPNTCFQPMGACCSDNSATATCTVVMADACGSLGNFLGANTTCTVGICLSPQIVVSQLYGGGGSSSTSPTPSYMQDYVELFNRSNATIDISGWTIQHASAAGSTWDKTTAIPANTTIAPGKYFLIVLNQSGSGLTGADLSPQADLLLSSAASVAFAGTNGKAALVRTASLIPSGTACPAIFGSVVDFVGYGGAGTNCFEGATGAVGNLSTTTAAFRAMDGCQDTNDNTADFTIAAPAPRNGATAANPCGVVPPAGVCCRGATCNATIASSAACTATLVGGQVAGASFPAGAACNSSGSVTTPCCYADYNKVGGINVQDIFDFLADWFAGSPYANTGGSGAPASLQVQNIFDFLAAWFAGGC